jgi:two-component system LytT family response regulator
MNPLRVILVDDERLARQHLAALLREQPGIIVAGEAGDLTEAIALLAREPPDVIFLDVSMPPENGFDLLPHVPAGTRVVFVTAHADHAVRAFDEKAADYLLKPVKPERLAATLDRLGGSLPSPDGPTSLLLGDAKEWHRVPREFISAVFADGNYSRIHLMAGQKFLMRRPIQDWIRLLGRKGFVALSRSLLVNPAAVLGMESVSRQLADLRLQGILEPVRLGRTAIRRARSLLML